MVTVKRAAFASVSGIITGRQKCAFLLLVAKLDFFVKLTGNFGLFLATSVNSNIILCSPRRHWSKSRSLKKTAMVEEQKIDNGLKFIFCMFFTSANLFFADAGGWKDKHIGLKLVLCRFAKIFAIIVVVTSR